MCPRWTSNFRRRSRTVEGKALWLSFGIADHMCNWEASAIRVAEKGVTYGTIELKQVEKDVEHMHTFQNQSKPKEVVTQEICPVFEANSGKHTYAPAGHQFSGGGPRPCP